LNPSGLSDSTARFGGPFFSDGSTTLGVMPGLDPGIHEAARRRQRYVSPQLAGGVMDRRIKFGDDGGVRCAV
jgi:hypothetical protein